MASLWPIFPFAALSIFIFGYAVRRTWGGSIQFLPSIGWAVFMSLPFCVEFPLFSEATRLTHMAALGFFTILIGGSDYGAEKIQTSVYSTLPAFSPRLTLALAYALGAIFIALTAVHIMTAREIPLLTMIMDHPLREDLDRARANFSRDLNVLAPLRYLFSFSITFFAVPAILLLASARKFIPAAFLTLWAIIYALASTAKGPVVLAAMMLVLGVVIFSSEPLRRRILRTGLVLAFAGTAILAVIDAGIISDSVLSELPLKYSQASQKYDDHHLAFDLGDYKRDNLNYGVRPPGLMSKIDYGLYRTFFTPIEVSARWYEYFYTYPVDGMTLSRRINDSRTHAVVHPARAVSNWAYHERFPVEYGPNASAYASIDADAWGRYGWAGFFAVGLAYVFLRLAIVAMTSGGTKIDEIYGMIAIVLFMLLASASSLQAMLIAHGIAPLFTALVAFTVWRYFRRRYGAAQ